MTAPDRLTTVWGEYVRADFVTPAALPAVTVGVKPLEWHQTSTEPARWLGHQADVSNPDYVIHLTADSPDVFAWGLDGDGWHGFCDTLETAQTAAQADYEARILAALEPQPAPDAAIREAVLLAAWTAVYEAKTLLDAKNAVHALLTEKPHDR